MQISFPRSIIPLVCVCGEREIERALMPKTFLHSNSASIKEGGEEVYLQYGKAKISHIDPRDRFGCD